MTQAHQDVIEDVLPVPAGSGGIFSARSVLTNKRGMSFSLPEVLVAVGLSIGGAALVTVGIASAINFSKDSGAKTALDSVKSAQILYQQKTGSFGSLEQLTTGETPALTDSPANFKLAQTETNYCGIVRSTSMSAPTYWITAKSGKILETAPTAAQAGVACPTL